MNDNTLTQQFFEEIGLSGLSPEEQEQFKAGFLQSVYDNVNVRILDMMTDEQVEKLNQLLASGDTKAVDDYQRSVVPDYDKLIGEEFVTLKQEVKQSQAEEVTDAGDTADDQQEYATILSQPLYDSSQLQPPPVPPKLSKAQGEV